MQGPLVSVILPTYNRAALLPRAVESVLSQDYSNLELIIIDDGSTDNTPEIVSSIADPRVRCIRLEQNRGIGAARNEGVHHALGEFTAFIDSDDIWLPGKLTRQVGILLKYPHIGLLFCDFVNSNYVTGVRDRGFYQNAAGLAMLDKKRLDQNVFEICSHLPEAMLCNSVIGTASIVMLRTSIFARIGNFDKSLSGPEDFEFWWRAALNGVRFAYMTEPLVERNKDEKSITSNVLNFSARKLQALDLCTATAIQNGRTDLLPHLRAARHRVWRSLVFEHARCGERHEAWRAFRRSLSYGNSLQAWAYVALSLLGAGGFQRLKQARHLLAQARGVS